MLAMSSFCCALFICSTSFLDRAAAFVKSSYALVSFSIRFNCSSSDDFEASPIFLYSSLIGLIFLSCSSHAFELSITLSVKSFIPAKSRPPTEISLITGLEFRIVKNDPAAFDSPKKAPSPPFEAVANPSITSLPADAFISASLIPDAIPRAPAAAPERDFPSALLALLALSKPELSAVLLSLMSI